ncbi:hypothetical protein F183_A53460 [Bryobacterales bacterium F-183]|nr:hypothetical protein F183_A53460 [Bryobacterales bacterium F-183]
MLLVLAVSQDVSVMETPKRFLRNEAAIWTSPVRKSNYSSRAVKKYLIPFAAITGTLIATDKFTSRGLPNSSDQLIWSGRASQMGAWYSTAGLSGAALLYGQFSGNRHMRETGILALEALGHAQVVTFAIKQATNRRRPVDGDEHIGFWKAGTAFPSGHSASAFAVATVFAYEYRQHKAVPIAAYGLASLVAVSRVGARRHWMSDIFAGGSMGFMMGRFIYRRHHNPDLPGVRVTSGWKQLTKPDVGFAPGGASLNWRF